MPSLSIFLPSASLARGDTSRVLLWADSAFAVSRTEPARVMNQSSSTSTSGLKSQRSNEILVACKLALALTLMVGAGLLLKSFWKLIDVELGFANRELLTLDVRLPTDRYYENRQRAAFHDRVVSAMQALPGVQAVGTTTRPPLGGMTVEFGFRRAGDPPGPTEEEPTARYAAVGPEYFEAAGIPVVEGRVVGELDTADAAPIVLISRQMAERYWPGRSPLGDRITVFSKHGFATREIVGVVGDVRYGGFAVGLLPHMYVPYAQEPWPRFSVLLAASASPLTLAESARSVLAELDPKLPVRDVATMEAIISRSSATPRFHLIMLLGFAAAALFLSAIGTYGMMAYSVSRRTRELGLRKALGAENRDLIYSVMGRGLVVIASGIALGSIGSLLLSSLLSGWLYEVEATDPATFVIVPIVLALSAALACFMPALRSTKVDPLVALRFE